ncbi:MAG: hypothetical protein MK008_12885 [Bdellovibrionales bacterium]|nr:hypothetical protein [Bdellovibrionales bacterium]
MKLIFLLLFSFPALAVDVGPNDILKIKGYEGSVNLITHNLKTVEAQYQVKNQSNVPWTVRSYKDKNKVVIEVVPPANKAIWQKSNQSNPQFALTVKAPSMPTEIYWQKGKVHSKGRQNSLKITALNVDLRIEDHKGDVSVFNNQGQIVLKDVVGDLDIESYSATTQINATKGELKLNNFSGNMQLVSHKGSANLKSSRGKVLTRSGEGKVEFEGKMAQFNFNQQKGSIRGKSDIGAVNINSNKDLEVSVRSDKAPIILDLKNSGAWVNLGTKEGNISAASYLKTKRYSTLKVIMGRLRGSQSGKVFVRTKTGDIILK